MYCQKCGHYNSDHSIYCHNDGEFLLKRKGNININKTETKFCNSCGKKVEKCSLYCSNCGQSLFQIEDKKKTIKKPIKYASTAGKSFKKINYATPLKTAIIAFVILLVANFIVTMVIDEKFINEILYEFETKTDIKPINLLDYTLVSHLVNFKIETTMLDPTLGSDVIEWSGGLFILLFIPFIIFLVLGIFKARKDVKSGEDFNLKETILMGLFYGLGLMILALLNMRKINIYIPFVEQYTTIIKKYSPLASLFNGLIIAVVFYLTGYGIYIALSKQSQKLSKYRYIFNGISCLGFGYMICLIVYLIFFLKYKDFISFTDSDFFDFIIHYQFPSYLWNLVNLNSFSCFIGDIEYNISLVKNIDNLKDILENRELIVTYILTLAPFILFFLQGRKEKRLNSGNIYLNLGCSSLTYSLLMTFFTAISNFKFKIMSTTELLIDEPIIANMGFHPVRTFFVCFLFFYLISLAGAFLTKNNEGMSEIYE